MSYDSAQFRALIERTLDAIGMRRGAVSGIDATNLLLGTAAQESKFGTYLRQMRGPALGAFQMEPDTFAWLQRIHTARLPEIASRNAYELEWNLRLAIIMARLRYLVVKELLPGYVDVAGMAKYWNRYYNANPHAGTDAEFIASYQRYVK